MKTTFTFLLVLISFTAFGQQNFVQGHYTTVQGHQVQAYINDKNWDRNPDVIEVKTDLNSNSIQKLGLSDIKSFTLSTGDRYDAFEVDVDKSPTKLNDILPGSQPVIVRDTVFLKTIVKGAASLYFLKDESLKEHYYVQSGDQEPAELIYRTAKFEVEGRIGSQKLPVYRGVLTSALTECPEVAARIGSLSYNQKALKSFVEDYNQCVSGSKGEYVAMKEKVKWEFSAIGGVSALSMRIYSEGEKDLSTPSYSGSSYTGGVAILATLPRGRGKWGIKNEIMYKPYKFEGTYEEGRNVGQENYTRVETTFDMASIGVNTLVQYKLLDSRIKPYIAVGFANNFIVQENNSQTRFRRYYGVESTREQPPFEKVRKHEQALLFGLGAVYSKFAAEVRLESGNGFSPNIATNTARKTASLQVSYTL